MPRSHPPSFAARIVEWQRHEGRNALPWQGTRDAYRIWLSEIMLQQTRVETVIPYYERFLARWPSVGELAAASVDQVLALWSGLGYYARGRNLHRAACEVRDRFGGEFPRRFEHIATLPGVGRSTAAAIAAFAGGERRAILDGNVRRVLARHAGIDGDPTSAATMARLWEVAESQLPHRDIERYTQGMMDLGAGVCTARNPRCLLCPVGDDCVARAESRIDELPGKRRRAERPRRHVSMLVALRAGEVLLEKRPAAGIWGGLWSLPEFDRARRAEECLARDWGLEAQEVSALEPFEHQFTHFTLEVTPWRARVRPSEAARDAAASMWLALSDLDGAALPSPVKRLLRSLANAA